MDVQERRPETMARSVCGQGLYRPRLAGRLWRGGSDPRTDQGSETGNEAHPCAFAARQLRHLDAGPALLKFGTEDQKVHYLTQIARGEIRWCQGYSEPGAGSDLVSLQTFGDDKGDHWVVNGSKIWTSYADKADWIFCLVRTDKANKNPGHTFIPFLRESKALHPN